MTSRLLALGLLAALALTACSDNQAQGGTAATVGQDAESVSIDVLAGYVQQATENPAASSVQDNLLGFQRDVLTALVTTDLYEVAAQRAGVHISQAQVDAQFDALAEQNGGEQALLAAAAKEGLSRELLMRLQRGRALNLALGNKLTQDIVVDPARLAAAYAEARDVFDRVTIARLQLPDLATARALLPQARLLDDSGFQDLVRTRNDDQTGGVLGPLTRSQFDAAGEQDYGTAVFSAQEGETLLVEGASGIYLVRILDRDTQSLEQASPRLRQVLLQEQISSAVRAAVADIDVDINPRFGVWNRDLNAVVPAEPTRPLSRPDGLLQTSPTELGAARIP